MKPTYLLLLVLSILSVKCQKNNDERIAPKTPEAKAKLLIAQQPEVSNMPQSIAQNISHIESLPFDGMLISSSAGWRIMRGDEITYAEMDKEFAPLKNRFKKFKYNFVMTFINFPGDLWNDEAWLITTKNFANLAKIAHELGFAGIVFDNEEYSDNKWLNYGEDYKNEAFDLNQHRDKTIERGKQIMEGMVSEFPNIEVLHYHGPYLSEKEAYKIIYGQAGRWDKYELLGPFFVGMVLGKGTKGKLIDGGEVYQYRTKEDFQTSYNVRKFEMASEKVNSWFIPHWLRGKWPEQVDIAFGVFNQQWKENYPMNVNIMRTTLQNALEYTDNYVWFYTQDDNWLIPGKMPKEWIEMVKEVRNK
jgi:hypothetical protein